MMQLMQIVNLLCATLYVRFDEFKREERGAVDIVAIVVMIGIAVILAVVFRKQVTTLLETLFSSITQSATDAIEG